MGGAEERSVGTRARSLGQNKGVSAEGLEGDWLPAHFCLSEASGRPVTPSPAEWAPHRSEEKRRHDLFCPTLLPPFCNCPGGADPLKSRKAVRFSPAVTKPPQPSTQLC